MEGKSFRRHLADFARSVGVALVTAAIIVGALQLAYGAQTAQQARVADTLVRAGLAQACELALPVGPQGRDPDSVELCFTQYGLTPPITQNP